MTVTQETHSEALVRLLQVARESGVQLKTDHEGHFWATSVSEPGRLYAVSESSCGCRGFAAHGRCRHLAALLSHLGKLEAAVKAPVIELRHTAGGWVDDDLTPAGMVRWVRASTSLLIGGVEEVRVTGDDTAIVATFRPGTVSATDLKVLGSHFATVTHYARMLDPEGFEAALAAAEMFAPSEFLEEAELVAA